MALPGLALANPSAPALHQPPPIAVPKIKGGLPAPPPVPASKAEPRRLSYESAPLLALAHNPTLAASLTKVRADMAQAEINAAASRPQGTLKLQGPPIPPSDNSAFRSDFVLAPIQIELRKLIYDGGRIAALIAQARQQARADSELAQSDWQKLEYQVRLNYLQALIRESETALAENRLQLARQQLRTAEARFRVGKAPKGDVLSAGLPVSEAELEAERVGLAAQQSKQRLNLLLGLPIDTPLQLEPPQLKAEELKELSFYLEQAQKQRPELRSLEFQKLSGQKAAEAGDLLDHPTVNLLAGVAAISQGTQPIGAYQYRAGFEVAWLFADGNKSGATGDLARAQVAQTEALLADRRRTVEVEVREAYQNLATVARTYDIQKKRVQQAEDAQRIAQAQYRAGMTTVYRVHQTQVDLYQAQKQELQAYFDYFQGLAQLHLATGLVTSQPLDIPYDLGEDG
jgi:outer membrane protein TolC